MYEKCLIYFEGESHEDNMFFLIPQEIRNDLLYVLKYSYYGNVKMIIDNIKNKDIYKYELDDKDDFREVIENIFFGIDEDEILEMGYDYGKLVESLRNIAKVMNFKFIFINLNNILENDGNK